MKKLLILSSFITILSAGFVNVETGWEYQQSTFQAFYMLETTENTRARARAPCWSAGPAPAPSTPIS